MKKVYVWTFLALLVTYIILAFGLPVNPQTMAKYGLSHTELRLLSLTTVLPLVFVYLAALYGFTRINDYANKIQSTKEGPHFKKLASGLMVLAFSLPVNSIIGSLTTYVRHAHPHMVSDISIVRQYVALALAFTAIYLIAKGAGGLYGTLKNKKMDSRSVYGMLGPIVLASIYTWLIVAQVHHLPAGQPYYLPDWLVVLTIAVPYVYIWCVGAWGAFHLYKYQDGVKGLIYKRAIDNLAKGIAAVIVISILLQFLTTLSGLLNRLELTPLLIIVYILIAFYALGYALVARGAKKLKQIEEA